MQNTRLRTQLQVATRRAATIAKAAYRAAFERRLDPAAYSCHRDGAAWIAEGPADQRFEFHRMPSGEVECRSHSGMSYIIRRHGMGWDCSCPCPGANDKHLVAWEAVKMAHKMERQQVRTALSLEADAMKEEEQAARQAGIEGLVRCEDCDCEHDSEVCPVCEYRDYVPGEELVALREAAEEAERAMRAEAGAANAPAECWR